MSLQFKVIAEQLIEAGLSNTSSFYHTITSQQLVMLKFLFGLFLLKLQVYDDSKRVSFIAKFSPDVFLWIEFWLAFVISFFVERNGVNS